MQATDGQVYDATVGVLGILIAPLWLCLIWLSLKSGVGLGWRAKPQSETGAVLASMLTYSGLAVGFAWRGFARL